MFLKSYNNNSLIEILIKFNNKVKKVQEIVQEALKQLMENINRIKMQYKIHNYNR